MTNYCTFPILKLPEIMYDVSQSHSASDRISEANKLPAFGVEKSCFLIAKGTTWKIEDKMRKRLTEGLGSP